MTLLTANQMVEQALGRVAEVTTTYPSVRGPMYRRLGIRQRQLYVRAAQINPDYYGSSVVVTLTGGAADLSALDDVPELVQRIEISAPGSSSYATGREISLVSMTDPSGELAPRATLRDLQLAGVGTDLTGVTSLTVWFSRLPASIGLDGASTVLALDEPWNGLLELDLAIWILEKATLLAADTRAAGISAFRAEEALLLNDYEGHLRSVAPTISRFVNPLTRSVSA